MALKNWIKRAAMFAMVVLLLLGACPLRAEAAETTEAAQTEQYTSDAASTEPTSSTDSPATGDSTNDLPWVALLCAVIVGMFCCLRYLDAMQKREKDRHRP